MGAQTVLRRFVSILLPQVFLFTFVYASISVAAEGDLISVTKVRAVSLKQVEKGRTQLFPHIQLPTARSGFVVYKLIYETVDLRHQATQASGALAVPDVNDTPAPLLSYQHGTTVLKNGVPSRFDIEEIAVAMTFAPLGYVIASPDYLGLGDSAGLHPYHHADSEAWASADMLRATRQAAGKLGLKMNDQLFLAGYSQGGHSTMALERYLENERAGEFPVTAAAPMSGAYDLSHTTFSAVIGMRGLGTVVQASYLMLAMNEVYGLFPSLETVFPSNYAAILPGLFDGSHSTEQIGSNLPNTPLALVRSEFIDGITRNPQDPFLMALEKNDVYDWKPAAPLRLYYTAGDDMVPPKNSQIAFDRMSALGANVQLVKVSDTARHIEGVEYAFGAALGWFETLR